MIEWSLSTLDFIRKYFEKNRQLLDDFATYPSGHLGLVDHNGDMELYEGRLRAVDAEGNRILDDIDTNDYADYFREGVERWSYMKFPYLTSLGRENGWNRVGPLARVNICRSIPTPLAEEERKKFMDFTGDKVNNRTLYTHWARLIEILHCAEVMKDLLHDPDLLSNDLVRSGEKRLEGIGIIEAPRGTLTHHYQVDEQGMITRCNLIVSTTHNNEAMNRAVRWVANKVISEKGTITEGMLNQVEVAIRAYDPCLSCATQAIGQMPLQVQLFNHLGDMIDERIKNQN